MSKTLTSIKNPHTGWGFCPEHKALKNQGFIALVECDPDKTREHTPAGAHRTGRIVHIKEEVARNLFNTNLGDKGLAFIEPGVLEKLAEIYERDTGEKLEH